MTRTDDLVSNPRPARSYGEALAELAALQARDGPEVNPVCTTGAMLHGHPVERSIVLLHGLTNCPRQFYDLGLQLHDRGFNVLIPRIPRHGLCDRMTTELSRLTAAELVAFTDQVVDVACGVGDRVAVAGLSAGGVMAAWAAQQRTDVGRAVLIAPCFSMGTLPASLSGALTDLCLRLPNFYRWWDSREKEHRSGPTYAYPRFSTRGMGEVLRLGLAVRRAAARRAPAARSIAVVTVGNDSAVSNSVTADLVKAWRRVAALELETYEFAADLGLPHDLIDPHGVNARVDLVYPVLLELITH